MKDNEWLDDIRRRIQEALAQSKRDELLEKYGMQAEYKAPTLPPEVENEWLDYILEFERQFEQAKRIVVRERIGNPPVLPLSDLPLSAVGDAIEALLDLLAAHGIAVDFLGEVDELEVYRYLTEELLDEQIDDIRIEGMWTHFTYSTVAYDVGMWVEHFVMDIFIHERKYFLASWEDQPHFDAQGEPITAEQFRQKVEAVWQHLSPDNRFTVKPITTEVGDNEATVIAAVAWYDEEQETERQVESFFRLQPSPYEGWDVVQTTLLDDLLEELR